jgi:hypothetical protein
MVRESLEPGSRNWHVKVTPRNQPTLDGSGTGANGYETNRRNIIDGDTLGWSGQMNDHSNPDYPNAWLRLQRTNTTLVAYRSDNGADWTTMAVEDKANADLSPDGSLANDVFIGIATTSHNNTVDPKYRRTAVYKNFSGAPGRTSEKIYSIWDNAKLYRFWADRRFRLQSAPLIEGPWGNWGLVNAASAEIQPFNSGRFFRLIYP